MNSLFCKIFKVCTLVFGFIILTGCSFNNEFTANAIEKQPVKTSAWITYWDLDEGAKEFSEISRKLENIAYFGAYFDKDGRMFIPQELRFKKAEIDKKKGRYTAYLTFVNDKQNADKLTIMKDIEVLGKIFSDDVYMDKHIDEILELTLQGGYDGIEIDYERIWTDEKIGQSFLLFTDKLYLKALKNNLKLRIVLEPGTPFSSIKFTKGPEYVVMIYNLYGLHSGPGPKANKDFIKKIVSGIKDLPGEKSIAFSTGGCLWGDNGYKKFITEKEAKTLAATYDADPERDSQSQCVFFNYKDKCISYQVWYADVKTINYWITVAQELGENNISLWRLGGNVGIDKIKNFQGKK